VVLRVTKEVRVVQVAHHFHQDQQHPPGVSLHPVDSALQTVDYDHEEPH